MPKSKHEVPGRVRATYEFIRAVLSENCAEPSGRSVVVVQQPAEPRAAADGSVRWPGRCGRDQIVV